jgi:EAL domain-containing protein (putative c-di-GMP-specific phosphodiesterase class I)
LGELLAGYPEVPPAMLKLEVLESAALHDIQTALDTMARCQALGISFAIDDFGTGFSSLTHLRQLPVSLIKIDQSFVRDMLIDRDDMAIVESVIYMANRFGHPMLAEGVETLSHAKALMSLGCTLAQGYGIARPMPPPALPQWLAEWPQRNEWSALAATPVP